ncbi:MAG: hypothetical protein K2Y56_06640 [Methylobacterium sp.]|uniref:hypothetical protein n=1 Tax=Methylobacterium sp. TaxID=409 RepID=UPI0025E7D0C2|nr:hypothetical protein [Methylobacterium sp.]MBX9931200.1 hypothetical protein [Methylobacterium sp.]
MSERSALLLVALLLITTPAAAEPAVTILDLPFAARHLRGPGSAVAVSVATSGLMPLARPKSSDPKATLSAEPEDAAVVVVWGEGGGAALGLKDGRVETTLIGAEAIEGVAATETPRGALPGSRGAVIGPVSAQLTRGESGPMLTIRERQPVAMSTEPKAVPIASQPVSAGPGAAFATFRPYAMLAGGTPVVAAVASQGNGASFIAVIGKAEAKPGSAWDVLGRSPPQAEGLGIAAIGPFAGPGTVRIATVAVPEGKGLLQLWAWDAGSLRLLTEAAGYTDRAPGAAEADLASPVGTEPPELALAVSDRRAVAILGLKDAIRERTRIALPAPAIGLSGLGKGAQARIVVALADGRVAVVTP